MISFKLGVLKTDVGRTGVVLQSESSQRAIRKLGGLDPQAVAIESPPAKAVELSPTPFASPAPETAERFYSDGRRMQRWRLWVSSLPLSFVVAFGFYLFLAGAPQWFVGALMLTGFLVFVLAGFLIEQRRLRAFVCPRCRAPIEDWDTNETHRIFFNCTRCGSGWNIEYKLWPGAEPYPRWRRRRSRSDFYGLCSSRGAH